MSALNISGNSIEMIVGPTDNQFYKEFKNVIFKPSTMLYNGGETTITVIDITGKLHSLYFPAFLSLTYPDFNTFKAAIRGVVLAANG